MESWRPLAFAAVLTLTVGAGIGEAQMLVVRNAPPGSPIELVLNSSPVGSATVNPGGDATITIKPTGADKQKDVRVYVDTCDKTRRVGLVERFVQPPPAAEGCDRKEIPGFFVARRVTTFVLDLGGATPMLWLRQGPAPLEWLTQAPGAPLVTQPPVPKGLMLGGGAGILRFSNVLTQVCGDVPGCTGRDYGLTYAGSVTYWFVRFAAAEAGYIRPRKLAYSGSTPTYFFTSDFDAEIFTLGGKVGGPVGKARIYGQGGVNYHRAVLTTNNTIDDATVTINGVDTLVPGGTVTYKVKTQGLGWYAGGGIEVWMSDRAAIYVDGGFQKLKGKAVGGGEGTLNENVFFVVAGLRVRIF